MVNRLRLHLASSISDYLIFLVESFLCCVRKVARLFNPGDFDSSKLTVRFEDNANDIKVKSVEDLLPRKYTLTHSDMTGDLLLSIGPSFNSQQVSAITT